MRIYNQNSSASPAAFLTIFGCRFAVRAIQMGIDVRTTLLHWAAYSAEARNLLRHSTATCNGCASATWPLSHKTHHCFLLGV